MPFGTGGKNRKKITLADIGIDPPGDRFAPRSGASPRFVLIVLLAWLGLVAIILAVASLPNHHTPPSQSPAGPGSAPDQAGAK